MRSSWTPWVSLSVVLALVATPAPSYPQEPAGAKAEAAASATDDSVLLDSRTECPYFKPLLLPVGTIVTLAGSGPQKVVCPIFGLHRLDAENYYALKHQVAREEKPLSFWQTPGGIATIAALGLVVGGVSVGLIVHYVPR